jgi:ABC-type Fe3+/spermidine/putrescine transport system ATPase subunit
MRTTALAAQATFGAEDYSRTSSASLVSNRTLVQLDKVSVDYGALRVLQPTTLSVEEGEFLTILGPSGSGKTTILKLMGGFIAPSKGRVTLNGKDISLLPPERRPFNTVFQDYALFPHMSVGENVAYSLRIKGIDRSTRFKEATSALELVGLAGYAQRRVGQLSGGQQQRVALARAIVAKPSVILLDEPLSALDAALRHHMQIFLKSIQRKLGTTFVFVTHDQQEALAMSDRIVVMNAGRIVQIGTPSSIYQEPASAFVATFIGRNNLLSASLRDPVAFEFATPAGPVFAATNVVGNRQGAVLLTVRPECIDISAPGKTPVGARNTLKGRINEATFGGSHYTYQVRVGQGEGVIMDCTCRADGQPPFEAGGDVEITFKPEDVRLVEVP